MKKSLLLAALFGATGAFAADSYLYWMVDTSSASNFGDYTYARIKDASTDTYYLTIYDGGFDTAYNEGAGGVSGVSKTTIGSMADWDDGFYASLAGITLSSASFIVELYNDSGKFLAQSFNDGSYDAVKGYIFAGGISGVSPVVPWSAGSFDVPEPSSGLLMLVGFAMLGLRRRRQTKENA